MHEHCALINVNSELFFDQFNLLFTIYGGIIGWNVQSSSARVAHCTTNHVTKCVPRC